MEEETIPPPPPTYTLTASSISYSKQTSSAAAATSFISFLNPSSIITTTTNILNQVTFTAYPAEILAVVDPSSTGKSTLLDILAARTSPTADSLLLNTTPITNSSSSFRKLSAYLPQHDAFLPLLIVTETFAFSARLLSSTFTSSIAAVHSDILLSSFSFISN
ncbi:unnamed protein product [Linum tenue]|uniref:ABC transporter domain-containing protein n=1 Tax=Linum tenue TaxID=586396 RepID=A0AAV0KYN5_9ROSI|nr:unnamed protein product [Linum tenue]